MLVKKLQKAAITLAALVIAGQASVSAALVTQTISGGYNDGTAGVPEFSTLGPNPLGLTNASVISGFVTYDDSIAVADGSVSYDGSNFDFELNIAGYTATPASDSYGGIFPRLLFDSNGFVSGIDLAQDNTNGIPVPCSGTWLGLTGDWCEFGVGPGAFFVTGAQAMRGDILSFEFVRQVQGGANQEVKFFEGLVQFSDPTPVETPEPGTVLLIGTALLGLGVYRRRRQ